MISSRISPRSEKSSSKEKKEKKEKQSSQETDEEMISSKAKRKLAKLKDELSKAPAKPQASYDPT